MSLAYGFALNASDNSADFSGAMNAVTGDGIATQGGQFAFSVNGFTVTLSPGYAYSAGRYLQNDEPYAVQVDSPFNSRDRVDALAVRVDCEARKAALEILEDVDIAEIKAGPSALRSCEQYCILLYLIRVRRGATYLSPDDITDLRADKGLCGSVAPMSDISSGVIQIYQFLNDGIDAEVARLIGLSNAVIARANLEITRLVNLISGKGGIPIVGDLLTVLRQPVYPGWVICDGSAVPAEYPVLSALLGGTLPDVQISDKRFKTYIYGGAPVEV